MRCNNRITITAGVETYCMKESGHQGECGPKPVINKNTNSSQLSQQSYALPKEPIPVLGFNFDQSVNKEKQ